MANLAFEVPVRFRRGRYGDDEQKEVESGVRIIQLIVRSFGLPDLGDVNWLDFGCGCKHVQAILDRDLPVGRYVGIDVYRGLIEYLQSNVADPRFSFHVLNAHNEMYNPEGEPLTANAELPIDEHSFDIVTLFSVFTHLAPHDYVTMLQLLRRYIKPDGRLLFSLFVNETTDGGFGLMDSVGRSLQKRMESDSEFREAYAQKTKDFTLPDYIDYFPDRPLTAAVYSREYALKLVQETGWEVESLNDPEKSIQHYMICKPV